MPFTTGHYNFLDIVLGPMLDDLGDKPDEFKTRVDDIQNAFSNKLTENNDYYQLQLVLNNPKGRLNKIEMQEPVPISPAELKAGLYAYVQEKVTKSAEKTGKDSPILTLPSIPEVEREQKFISDSVKPVSSITIPQVFGAVFTHTLTQTPAGRFVLVMQIEFTSEEKFTIRTDLPDHSDNDVSGMFSENYIYRVHKIELKAVGELAIKFFRKKNILSDYDVYQMPAGSKILLANRYFFDAVYRRKIKVASDLFCVLEDAAMKVVSAEGVELYKKNKNNFKNIKYLSKSQLQLIAHPYFNEKILTDQITLETVVKFTHLHCSNLQFTPLITLMKESVINVTEAISATEAARLFLLDEVCVQLLIDKVLIFQEIQDETTRLMKRLSVPGIPILLKEGIITKSVLLTYSNTEIDAITERTICDKLLFRKIHLNTALSLPYRTVSLLKNNAYVRFALEKDILSMQQVCNILTRCFLLNPQDVNSQPLDKNKIDIEIMRPLLQDFAILAENRLLFSLNMAFVFTEVRQISQEIAAAKECKDDRPGPDLLKSISIRAKCVHNISNRFSNVLGGSPLLLHDGVTQDSFACIKEDCEKFNFDFNVIALDILVDQIRSRYSYVSSLKVDEIVNMGVQVGFDRETMWGMACALRCFALYNGSPFMIKNSVDNLKLITSDLEKIKIAHNLSTTHLHAEFMNYLQKLIKNDLKSKYLDTPTDHSFHQTIYQVIDAADSELQDVKANLTILESRNKCFQDIYQFAKDTLVTTASDTFRVIPGGSKKRGRDPLSATESASKRGTSSLFFTKVDVDSELSVLGIRRFCRRIIELEPLLALGVEKPDPQLSLGLGLQ